MDSDLDYISDDEEIIVTKPKNTQKLKVEPKKQFFPSNQFKNNKKSKISQKIEKYDDLKKKIRSCFADGIIIPVMKITLIYTEKYTTMFDFKNSACLKGPYHNHKTVQKYFSCCHDSFQLIDGKFMFIRRVDHDTNELIKKRVKMHINNVSKNSPDKDMHLEILILTIFSCKTTVTIEDLETLFFKIYKIKLFTCAQFLGKNIFSGTKIISPEQETKYNLKVLQIINSRNMQVSITHKACNIICIPPNSIDFHDYKEKQENYRRVLAIEDQILRPAPEIKVPEIQKDIQISVNSPIEKIIKKTSLLDLAELNVPREIQRDDLDLLTPTALYKKLKDENPENELENPEEFLYLLQSLKLDVDEDNFVLESNKKKKN